MKQTILTHKDSDHPYNDRIEIPVIFNLTEDGVRVYDLETMQKIFDKMINSIMDHEKVYQQ
jgi:hypothetical protein